MQLPFWKDLTERERETVQRSAVTRRYEKGALIHDGGSECLGLVLVLSGELRTYLLSDEGREATLFIDGDMAKLPSPIKHMYVRRGAEPTTLLRYKGENFYEYASSVFF